MIVNAKFIADLVKGELKGDPERPVAGVSALRDAGPDQLSFLGSRKYLPMLEQSKAGTLIVSADTEKLAASPDRTLIVCQSVDYAFLVASGVFAVPAPEPVRGRRNEPANVRFVAEKLAEIRGETAEDTAAYTFENAKRFYGIP